MNVSIYSVSTNILRGVPCLQNTNTDIHVSMTKEIEIQSYFDILNTDTLNTMDMSK